MNRFPLLLAPVLALALAACATDTPATRASAPHTGPIAPASPLVQAQAQSSAATVRVPESLKVSEANRFYPIADIVWRGDPPGDRRAQVAAIFTEAIDAAKSQTGTPAGLVEVEVRRFHALTEKTRYTVGGVHSIRFDLTLRDPATGTVFDGPRRIVADVRGSGGAQAIEDDRIGRTQRVVIVERLTQVLIQELTRATGSPGIEAAAELALDPS